MEPASHPPHAKQGPCASFWMKGLVRIGRITIGLVVAAATVALLIAGIDMNSLIGEACAQICVLIGMTALALTILGGLFLFPLFGYWEQWRLWVASRRRR